jgi:hypothetical protein
MTPASIKLALVGILLSVLATAGGTWRVQDWRYGKQIGEQAGLPKEAVSAISTAAAAPVPAEPPTPRPLAQRLATSDKAHHKELSDAQTKQDRVRDSLATAELRLSVLLDAQDPASGCAVSAGTGAGGVVHGGTRARLDPAHAQRIIGITDAGDQGLIALAACQAYVRAIAAPGFASP